MQLSETNLPRRVQSFQALLPVRRVPAIVSRPLRKNMTQLILLVSGFLEGLCDYLYDHLRPRILHEPSLEILCGVCTVLQALMVQDVSDHAYDEEVLLTPDSTPGVSPFAAGGDDYFSSTPRRQSSFVSPSRKYSASILSRRESTRKKKTRKPLSRLHTEILLKMVLQDAQTRLVFRAQALIRADVDYYAPKEGDLDYPEKIASGQLRSCQLMPFTH